MGLLSDQQIDDFRERGFLIVPQLVEPDLLAQLQAVALGDLARREPPLELEADVHYPGSPDSPDAPGGDTIRRLLHAWSRHEAFRRWGSHPAVTGRLAQLFDDDALVLCQSHHNCVMTKMPSHSSATHWHRDVRYWSYSDRELINTWLALGPEHEDNGCMRLIPGTHRMTLGRDRLDEALFLREDLAENQALIDTAVRVELAPGDVLIFHAAAFHAAGRNRTDRPKLAVVYTYHASGTSPLPDSKSAGYPEIPLVSG